MILMESLCCPTNQPDTGQRKLKNTMEVKLLWVNYIVSFEIFIKVKTEK